MEKKLQNQRSARKNNIVVFGITIVVIVVALIVVKLIHTYQSFSIDSNAHLPRTENLKDSKDAGKMDHSSMTPSIASEEQFILNMIPHHQEAVDSSIVAAGKSTNPQVIALAKNIVSTQTLEIAKMQTWLDTWYPKSNLKTNYMNMMPNLSSLTGKELDTQYLLAMSLHHLSAIDMSKSALKFSLKPEVKTFAEGIISTQSKEVEQMQKILNTKN